MFELLNITLSYRETIVIIFVPILIILGFTAFITYHKGQ